MKLQHPVRFMTACHATPWMVSLMCEEAVIFENTTLPERKPARCGPDKPDAQELGPSRKHTEIMLADLITMERAGKRLLLMWRSLDKDDLPKLLKGGPQRLVQCTCLPQSSWVGSYLTSLGSRLTRHVCTCMVCTCSSIF